MTCGVDDQNNLPKCMTETNIYLCCYTYTRWFDVIFFFFERRRLQKMLSIKKN